MKEESKPHAEADHLQKSAPAESGPDYPLNVMYSLYYESTQSRDDMP